MPYLECPGCRLSLYSTASHSWIADACPVCGESLEGATKRFAPDDGVRTLCREFPSTPGSVGRARHAFDGVGAELGDALHMTVVLLVSELVTNSVRHSGAAAGVIELLACISPETVRVEVSDDGGGFDLPPIAHHDAESGHGLQLVQELADRWGRPTGLRTSVWFEIDRPAHPAPRTAAPAMRLVPALELRPVAT
ncbi:MAG: ATP-binding protein [Thermoleophilaceae bacterium]